MKEEQLNRLFREMAQQSPEVDLEEVLSWVEKAAPGMDPSMNPISERASLLTTKKTIIMLGTLITAIGASIWMFLANNGSDLPSLLGASVPIETEKGTKDSILPVSPIPSFSPIPPSLPMPPALTPSVDGNWERIPSNQVIEGLPLPAGITRALPGLSFEYFSALFSDTLLDTGTSESMGALEPYSTFLMDDFTEIRASSALDIVLRQGASCEVQIEAEDESDRQYVKYQVRQGVLELSLRKGIRGNKLKVIVTVRDLDRVDLSGAVDLRSEGVLRLDDLDLRLSGASSIDLHLVLDELEVRSSGSSDIELRGSCNEFDLRTSGASSVDAFDFEAKHCEIHASGASNIEIAVEKELELEADGASEIRYKGNPNLRRNSVSGAASVRQKRSN
jgi:hypothetical protein